MLSKSDFSSLRIQQRSAEDEISEKHLNGEPSACICSRAVTWVTVCWGRFLTPDVHSSPSRVSRVCRLGSWGNCLSCTWGVWAGSVRSNRAAPPAAWPGSSAHASPPLLTTPRKDQSPTTNDTSRSPSYYTAEWTRYDRSIQALESKGEGFKKPFKQQQQKKVCI